MSTEQSFTIRFLGETVFSGAQNRLEETLQPTIEGATAALETFYHALNERFLDLFRQIWFDHEFIQLNNPVGGIMRGVGPIGDLYARIFEGPVRVQVEFYDIVAYLSSEMAVFAGRERGTYERNGKAYPLDIRTSRIFLYAPTQGGWRQIHHHGSIDNPERLAHYQQMILLPQEQ
jgi:hypothetical protein